MKRIEEMTKEEILNLSEKEIEKMIKEQMMEEGVQIVAEPEIVSLPALPCGDKKVFVIPALSGFAFANEKEAQAVSNLLLKSKMYTLSFDYTAGVGLNFITGLETIGYRFHYSHEKVYSESFYDEIKVAAMDKESKEKEYEKQKRSYEQYRRKMNDIKDAIMKQVTKLRSEESHFLFLCDTFRKEYLVLAGNDSAVAMKFMAKAFELSDEQQQAILAECVN